MFNSHAIFEVSTTCNEDMKGNTKCKNFEPPFGGLRGNAQGLSMARWKTHCRLSISDNFTLFVSFHGSGTIKRTLSKQAFSEELGRSFVRSFVLCGQGSSLLWTPALRPYRGPVRLPRERKGIGRCVRCMLATCMVKEGLSRSEQLVGYFDSAPLLDVAYCLAQP